MSADGFDFVRTDVKVFGSEMQHHRAARFFCCMLSDSPTVVAYCRCRLEPRGRKPGQCSTEAVTEDAGFPPSRFCGSLLDCRADILQRCLQADLCCRLHSLFYVGRSIAEFKAGLYAIEQRWRNYQETLARIVIGNRPDMRIHAKDLLDQNQSGVRRDRVPGAVRLKYVAVRRCDSNFASHQAGIISCSPAGWAI